MKHFTLPAMVVAVGCILTGCATADVEKKEYIALTGYQMHGHDSIESATPVKPDDISEPAARSEFSAVPQEILNSYLNKIPDAIRKYNLQKRGNSQISQDDNTRDFIFAVIDYELQQMKHKPVQDWIDNGIRRNDHFPEVVLLDQKTLFKSSVSREDIRQYNIKRKKFEAYKKIDALVSDLLTKCGIKETDRFWFKKLAVLKYEFIGFAWEMYDENEKMKELL